MAHIFAKIQQLKVNFPNVTICVRLSYIGGKIAQLLRNSAAQ